MSEHTYQQATFVNVTYKPCLPILENEILADPTLSGLTVNQIINNTTECVMTFEEELSAPQISALDSVVAAHTGISQ